MSSRLSNPTSWLTAAALLPCLFIAFAGPALAAGDPVGTSISEQEAAQREAATSQQRIDELDDQTRIALDEYRETMRNVDQLLTYNNQMERMIESQNREIGTLERDINEIEVTQRQIMPLMHQMLEVLEQLVATDAPFLLKERETRLKELNRMMQDAGVSLADKFRRLLEAYQIEMEYGNTIEAYRAELPRSGQDRTVELLRIGRAGLYYVTLDQREAGVWDNRQRAWHRLPDNNIQFVSQGLRLARNELPPDLIRLPVAAPEQGS